MCFNFWLFPLTAAIVCTSAVLHNVIPADQADPSTLWFFHGSVASVLFSIAVIGLLHRSTDQPGTGIVPRPVRLLVRFAAVALIAVAPLFSPTDSIYFMAIVASILVAVVILETIGKIGTARIDLNVEGLTQSHSRSVMFVQSPEIADLLVYMQTTRALEAT